MTTGVVDSAEVGLLEQALVALGGADSPLRAQLADDLFRVCRRRFMESSCPIGAMDSHTSWTKLKGSGQVSKAWLRPSRKRVP